MKQTARKVGTIPSFSCPKCYKGKVEFKKFGSMLFGSCEKCRRTYAKLIK